MSVVKIRKQDDELEGPPPAALGLSSAPSWRPGQWRIVQGIADSPAADVFHLFIAPTGFGKSITYTALAVLTGSKTVILTATKSLQDQLMRDFEDAGMVDVRGMSNYECRARRVKELERFMPRTDRKVTVDAGPCRSGHKCPLKEGGCEYYDRVEEARKASLVVTNYDFWMHNRTRLGEVDLLVMDEAHLAPGLLAGFMSFRLVNDAKRWFEGELPEGEDVKEWRGWVKQAWGRLDKQIEAGMKNKAASDLCRELERVWRVMGEGEWVVEKTGDGEVMFDCVNAEDFGRKYLWGGVKRVLMVSATVNLMTAQGLGVCDSRGVVRECGG